MPESYVQLEREWAEFNRVEPDCMVACSSGTAALHLAVETLRPNWLVLPDYTMVACARACVLGDCKVHFVDCRDDLTVVPFHGPRMLVHVYGRRCHEDCYPGQGPVIEDLAEAHGIVPRGDAACWSFYRNKVVHGEEGGAVWFKDPLAASRARMLRCLGFTPEHDYNHIPRGHNYRMSNIHAELILVSLRAYEPTARREREQQFERACPEQLRMPAREVPWVYDFQVPYARDRIVRALRALGIAARPGFRPMSTLEEFSRLPCPNALRWSQRIIYVPIEPGRPRIDQVVFGTVQRELDRGADPTG